MTPEELLENFSLLDSWEDKYAYLIDLGNTAESFPEKDKTSENKIEGCQSQVWMTHEVKNGRHYFKATSDALIVSGLEVILLTLVNGKTSHEIKQTDFENFFAALGLEEHLSPTRRNGFFSMIRRIRSLI